MIPIVVLTSGLESFLATPAGRVVGVLLILLLFALSIDRRAPIALRDQQAPAATRLYRRLTTRGSGAAGACWGAAAAALGVPWWTVAIGLGLLVGIVAVAGIASWLSQRRIRARPNSTASRQPGGGTGAA